MKLLSLCMMFIFLSCCANAKEAVYTGSTPANAVVKAFLGISLKDSIDFIRWKLVVRHSAYDLQCQYGISKPNTNGFMDEKRVSFTGTITREGNYYHLVYGKKELILLKLNTNLFHMLDKSKAMLIGNGGWSYTLNRVASVKSSELSIHYDEKKPEKTMIFIGRTPCNDLSKRPECIKMKWYVVFYADSITGKPAYYLSGGMQRRRETMNRGRWEIMTGKEGRVIYKLQPGGAADPIYLLRVGKNILYFTDANGNLLVGNGDFSYSLNRQGDEYMPRTN
jgi:hypothetical protein